MTLDPEPRSPERPDAIDDDRDRRRGPVPDDPTGPSDPGPEDATDTDAMHLPGAEEEVPDAVRTIGEP
jgi:hypothetical protein